MGITKCISGGMCKCPFGSAPSSLNILPTNRVLGAGSPMGTIMDFIPMLNVKSFGMCSSLTNPAVASATASALGTLTPMPCTPIIVSPWIPNTTNVTVGPALVLSNGDKVMCMWGGMISISSPGQGTVC